MCNPREATEAPRGFSLVDQRPARATSDQRPAQTVCPITLVVAHVTTPPDTSSLTCIHVRRRPWGQRDRVLRHIAPSPALSLTRVIRGSAMRTIRTLTAGLACAALLPAAVAAQSVPQKVRSFTDSWYWGA